MSNNVKRCWVVDVDGVRELLADGKLTGGMDVRVYNDAGEEQIFPAAAVCWTLPQVVRRCLDIRDRWDSLATQFARKQAQKGAR